jgi:hypothetical protein
MGILAPVGVDRLQTQSFGIGKLKRTVSEIDRPLLLSKRRAGLRV